MQRILRRVFRKILHRGLKAVVSYIDYTRQYCMKNTTLFNLNKVVQCFCGCCVDSLTSISLFGLITTGKLNLSSVWIV